MALGLIAGVGVGVAVGSQLNLGNNLSAQNLAEKAGDKIKDVSGAAKNAVGSKFGNVKSAFESKDLEKNKKINSPDASKPKEKKTVLLTPLKSLSYYPTAMKYFMKFTIIDKSAENVLKPVVEKEEVHIYLPIPTNLNDTYSLVYDDVGLGTSLGIARDIVDTVRSRNRDENIAISEIGSSVLDYFRKTNSSVANTAIAAVGAGALAGLRQVGPIGAAIADQLRSTPNPYLATVFNNVQLRQHQFSYKFAPNSQDELKKIKEIILAFRKASLPSKGADFDNGKGILLKFPKEFKIEFYPMPNKPYFFERCVLTSLAINYAPSGSPAFFKTGDPVAVEITLNFQETRALTSEDIDAAENAIASLENPNKSDTSDSERFGGSVQGASV